MQRGLIVWSHLAPSVAANPDEVFAKLEVLSQIDGAKPRLNVRQIDPPGLEGDTFEVEASDCFEANDPRVEASVTDLALMPHRSPPCVLNFLRVRWQRGEIYTEAEPILISVNPFRSVGEPFDVLAARYRRAADVTALPPHVFSIARKMMDNYTLFNRAQTVIVSGESGAGKTEAAKAVMNFFAGSSPEKRRRSVTQGEVTGDVRSALLAANPILESLGNAQTVRNDNSSRFGRFTRLRLDKGLSGGSVQTFLLEKVRVVSHEPGERSFHIFYQLFFGLPAEAKARYGLSGKDPSGYELLSAGKYASTIAPAHDETEFNDVMHSFREIGLSADEVTHILDTLVAIVILGNVRFDDGSGDVQPASKAQLQQGAELLGLNVQQLVEELTRTAMKAGGGEAVVKRLSGKQAREQLLSFLKAIFERLFLWLVDRMNLYVQRHISGSGRESASTAFLGLLDIFGFEIFERNSLEQLLINLTNEYLQKHFVGVVFEREIQLYKDEGVPVKDLEFTTNQNVLDAFVRPNKSVFAALEDACLAPQGTGGAFISTAARMLGTGEEGAVFRAVTRGGSAPRFVIAHRVADVEYDATLFIEKNRDLCKFELLALAASATNGVLAAALAPVAAQKQPARGKLGKGQLMASTFLAQLKELISVIEQTEAHFIRCIKPNEQKSPSVWTASKVLNQLYSLSIFEALHLKELGFSWRRPFEDFCIQFKYLSPSFGMSDEQVGAQKGPLPVKPILARGKLAEGKDFHIGKTRVFLTAKALRKLAAAQIQFLQLMKPALLLIEAAMLRMKYRLIEEGLLPYLVRFQARCRAVCSMEELFNLAAKRKPPII